MSAPATVDDRPWHRVAYHLPPVGLCVETKISDERGERNVQPLICRDYLWWFSDQSMYIYYSPTHWRLRANEPAEKHPVGNK